MNVVLFFGLASSLLGVVAQEPAPKARQEPSPASAAKDPQLVFKVLRTFDVGGAESWDYLAIDAEARRLYVPRVSHVLVLDADTGKQVGDVVDTDGVHGVALAPELGRGFTSNDKTNTSTVFDLGTFAVVKIVELGKHPDAIVYEPVSKCAFIADKKGNDIWVLSAEKLEVVATIPVGGEPEGLVVDGLGRVFVNVKDTSEVVRIDAARRAIVQRMPLAPARKPAGLAIDAEHRLLFSVCGSDCMVVLDADSGKVLASPPIGKHADAVAFDAASGCALAAASDGVLTVVATRGGAPFSVLQTLKTAANTRTMVLDPKTHSVYLPTAEFEPQPAAAPGGSKPKPAMKPNTFRILVVGR